MVGVQVYQCSCLEGWYKFVRGCDSDARAKSALFGKCPSRCPLYFVGPGWPHVTFVRPGAEGPQARIRALPTHKDGRVPQYSVEEERTAKRVRRIGLGEGSRRKVRYVRYVGESQQVEQTKESKESGVVRRNQEVGSISVRERVVRYSSTGFPIVAAFPWRHLRYA